MGGLRSLQTPTGACRDGIGPHPGKKDEVPHSPFGGAAFQFPFTTCGREPQTFLSGRSGLLGVSLGGQLGRTWEGKLNP